MKWAVVPAAGRLSVAGGSVYGALEALSVRYRGGRIAVDQVQGLSPVIKLVRSLTGCPGEM
jgi:hypothetical protein